MRLFFFLLLLCASFLVRAQEQKLLTIALDKSPLISMVEEVEKKSSYKFFFIPSWIDTVEVTVRANNLTIDSVLTRSLSNTGIEFFIKGDMVILTPGIKITNDLEFFGQDLRNDPEAASKFTREIPEDTGNKNLNTVKVIGRKGTGSLSAMTLSGYIREKKSNEPLTGALVYSEGRTKSAVTTDQFGFYSLTLPAGPQTLFVELIGMNKASQKINLIGNGSLDITMEESITQLKEVVVESDVDLNVSDVQMGISKIDIKTMKNIPKVLGENDILKVATTLPGVKSVGEGASGINVRGGHADQNLVILNEATIYNTSHFLGFFSVFNPDAIRSFELYKTGIPVQHGGRLSSTFELLMRDGNQKKFSGEGGVGPITSNLTLEVPLVKDKTSLLAGGRSTYSNWVLRSLPESVVQNTSAMFYDYFAKITHSPNDKNTLYLSLYNSYDNFNLSSDSIFSYSNRLASFQWRHVFNPNMDAVLTLTRSEYDYDLDYKTVATNAFNMGFAVKESNLKLEFSNTKGKHEFTYGLQSKLYELNPGFINKGSDSSLVKERRIAPEKGLESAIFLADNFDISPSLSVYYGVRYSMFAALGPRQVNYYASDLERSDNNIVEARQFSPQEVIETFHGPEYRISGRYKLSRESAVKASYTRTRQYIHMLSNTVSVSPTDTWKLSDPNVKPQLADQISMGFYQDLKKDVFEFSAESYYKWIQNILDYKTGATLLVNEKIDQQILQGEGKAYGIELLIRKKSGKITGWLGYSYSRTLIKLASDIPSENINHGKFFPANYDKPHDLSLITNYKVTRRYSFSFNFAYSTGRPITYPISAYRFGNTFRINYSDRNAYRVPDYLRFDLGFNIEGNHKIKKLAHSYWSLSIYNLLGRQNPYSIYFKVEDEEIHAYKLSIFGAPIPTVSYHFKF